MKLTTREILMLQLTNSESEWNHVCDNIKFERNGTYPPDWYARIVQSGFAYNVMQKWEHK